MLKRHAKKMHPRSRFVFVLLCFIGVSQMLSPVRANRLATGETLTSIADTGRTEIRKQVVIQPGGSDDTVLEDATISSWSPDENYGGDPQVKIRPGDGAETMNALLRWNLDVVPTGSLIQSATLEMYCTQATGSPMGMSIFQVLRPWQEASVTWEKASTGMSWATAGCQAPGVDRASAEGAVAALELETGWRSWDITTLVQSWVDDPPANHGMVLVPAEFHPRTEYTFASAEAYASVRPRLIIEYSTSTRTPTPSPSPTRTPTFQATPTPTATSTAAATATASPTSAARGAIQGLVYQDWNEDGEFTAGEPGLGNVLVTLKDSTGRQIDFKTTASDGSFLFPSLTPGTYRVEQYDLPGTYSTTPNLIYVPIEAGDLLWVSFGDRYSTTLTPTAEATAPLFFTYLPLSSKSLSFPLDKPTPTATPTTISYSQAVNCGSSEGYQASDDFWYAPDQVYTPGSWGWEGRFSQTWVSGLDVQGTGDDPLYDSQRHSMDAYRFSVPAGQYQVLLCFAEIFQYVKAGDRLFAVEIEGRRVLDQFDMVALGARNRALEQVFTAPVSDGVLDVVFVPQTANYSPVINAIRVQRIKSPQ